MKIKKTDILFYFLIALFFAWTIYCRTVKNNEYVKTNDFERSIRPTSIWDGGLLGYKEYTKHSNGSVSLKIVYHGLKLTIIEVKSDFIVEDKIQKIGLEFSKLIQDLDGDGDADKITIKGIGFKTKRRYGDLKPGLNEVLYRKHSWYGRLLIEFNKANKLLKKEKKHFDKKTDHS